MAPESERAKMSMCANCDAAGPPTSGDPCAECGHRMAPATCSEVVERLFAECVGGHDAWVDRAKAAAILHSWRERRVQELEAAIRNFGYWLDEDQVSMWCKVCDAGKGTQHARIYGVDTKDWGPCPVGQAEDSEQIRKGAKHE